MIVPFKNIVNTMYAMEFSKKSMQTWEMAKKSGNANGIAPPMGYLRDGDHMVLDPATKPYVRIIFAWRLAGVPARVIVERLNLDRHADEEQSKAGGQGSCKRRAGGKGRTSRRQMDV